MDLSDKAKPVRNGESLDLSAVEEYLKSKIPSLSGSLAVEQFPSGFSNLTYLISVGDRELVLRRPPHGTKAKSAHDMGREYRMLKALKPVFPYCPEALLYCEDESVMGCPFYIMERIKGIILRRDLPKGLSLTPEQARCLCESLVDVQHELHSIDYRKIGLEDYGRPEGYARRQVEGWSQRYRNARTPDAPDYERVMSWLVEKMPGDTARPTIVHNDYKFDNVVLDVKNPLRIIGVLDWEMATIGDPLMDLGNSLAYWVQKSDSPGMQLVRMMPTNIDGALTREDLVKRYAQKSGMKIDNFDFYYCFGLFRLAVIAQQIYYRFFHGQTKDERFRMLIGAVKILEETAVGVIGKSRI